jgi:transcriptional regulator with XRE-family HTH domain
VARTEHVGENLRRLLGMHLMRMDDFAARLGLSAQAVYNIAQGRSEPRARTALAIAEAFGIELGALFSEPGACVRAGAAAFDRAPVRAVAADASRRAARSRAARSATPVDAKRQPLTPPVAPEPAAAEPAADAPPALRPPEPRTPAPPRRRDPLREAVEAARAAPENEA